MKSRIHATTSAPARGGRLSSAALLLSLSFVASRVLGLLRNAVLAHIFGNTPEIQAYFAAFRLPDAMFTLVSGGALASAFVPLFASLLAREDETEAWEMASTVLNTVVLLLGAGGVLAFAFAPQIMDLLVQGFTPSERTLTIELTRIMLLQPIFLGVAAILASVLQTYHRFTLTAVAPLLYNLAIILGALILGPAYGVRALAWAVVIGALLQLIIQLPGLRGYVPRLNWHLPAAREVLRLLGPRVVGLAAFQLMLFITLYLAAGLPEGMVGAINYSWPLIQFPIGVLGTAAGTAIFPTLSRLVENRDVVTVQRTVNRSLRLILFLSIPSAVGLIVLRRPIINLLYNHGTAWTPRATEQTAFALLFYAMALPALSAIEVLPRVFYAARDTRTPVRIAVVTVAVDAVLSVALVHLLPRTSGQGGLALATAVASTIQVLWLVQALEARFGSIGSRGLLLTARDAAIASLVMALALYVALDPLSALLPQYGLGAVITVGFEVALGAAAFVAASWILGAPELSQVRGFLGR